jgi:hypothetical protein
LNFETFWVIEDELEAILEPYLTSTAGKDMRTKLIQAFNVPTDRLGFISKVVSLRV